MAKASVFVKQILSQIVTRGSEAPIEPDEAQDTIFMMNSYMDAQASNGISLGYTEISDLGQEVTIPSGANMGVIANVAVMMSPTFGASVTPELALMARTGLDAMRKLGVNIGLSVHPSTLPIGSGNEGDFTFDNDHFFPEDEALIAKEDGGSIALETSTDV